MAKEDKPLFLKALLLVVIILLLNTGAFSLLYKDNFSTGFSGRAVKQVATNAYQNTSKLSKIFLLSQWGLLLAFLVTAFVRDRVVAKSSKKLTNVKVTKSTPSKTDLDTLYEYSKKENSSIYPVSQKHSRSVKR